MTDIYHTSASLSESELEPDPLDWAGAGTAVLGRLAEDTRDWTSCGHV